MGVYGLLWASMVYGLWVKQAVLQRNCCTALPSSMTRYNVLKLKCHFRVPITSWKYTCIIGAEALTYNMYLSVIQIFMHLLSVAGVTYVRRDGKQFNAVRERDPSPMSTSPNP